jgi:hypothetical protein
MPRYAVNNRIIAGRIPKKMRNEHARNALLRRKVAKSKLQSVKLGSI